MKAKKILLGTSVLLAGLVGAGLFYQFRRTTPEGVAVVQPFDLDKYLGKWYEIARFDFYHEKDMDNVTAEYSLNDDGSVKVVNRGYNYKEKKDKEAIGRAVLVGDENEARLKVSFFGPFYAGYNVLAIDAEYKYALVAGRNKEYLWILSREKTIPDNILDNYLELAENYGFDVADLVWTKQD